MGKHVEDNQRRVGHGALLVVRGIGKGHGPVEILGRGEIYPFRQVEDRDTVVFRDREGLIDHNLGDDGEGGQAIACLDIQPHRNRAYVVRRRTTRECQRFGIKAQPAIERCAAFATDGDAHRIREIDPEGAAGFQRRNPGEDVVDRGVEWLLRIDDELDGKALLRRVELVFRQRRFLVRRENNLHPRHAVVVFYLKARQTKFPRGVIVAEPRRQRTPADLAGAERTGGDVEDGDIVIRALESLRKVGTQIEPIQNGVADSDPVEERVHVPGVGRIKTEAERIDAVARRIPQEYRHLDEVGGPARHVPRKGHRGCVEGQPIGQLGVVRELRFGGVVL